jgi:hypothetical protein
MQVGSGLNRGGSAPFAKRQLKPFRGFMQGLYQGKNVHDARNIAMLGQLHEGV